MSVGDPHDPFEVEALRALASGRPEAVLAEVDASGREDVVAALLRADAQTRQLTISPTELQGIVARVHAEASADLRLRSWANAILAERLFADLDGTCLLVARQALDELEGSAPILPPLALRYARARLSRIVAAGWIMLASPDGLTHYIEMRDRALADLLGCGFTDEIHATRGAGAGLVATMFYEDIRENHHLLVDARAALGEDHDSMWSAILDYLLGINCFEMGDMVGSLQAYDRLDAARFQHRRIAVLPKYGRAFFRLVTAGASPATIEGLEQALAEVRRHDPQVAQYWYGHLAHTLADMGSRAASHFVLLEGELPPFAVGGQSDRRFLQLRVAALAGEPVSTDEVLTLLDRLAASGQRRRAARHAVRHGHDLAIGGDADGARLVHQWGLDRLPPEPARTVWEQYWSRPVDTSLVPPPHLTTRTARGRGSSTSGRSRPAVEVRVLAPTVEVEVDGEPVVLSDAQAKLLLALVVAFPAPLHVERASDVLWPDEALNVTRPRLNSLMHRLRRVLHPHGAVIGRTGELLLLDRELCHADLWWFQQALSGDPEERKAALLSVRGNLGDAQFPYDEGFFDERHRLSGEWVRHACRAHRGGEIDLSDLEPALSSLNLTTADLDA